MINHFKILSVEAAHQAGRRAFSLIEVMIAIAITSIIFSAVYYGISTGFGLVQSAREQMRANQVCLARMEGIRLCNWDTQLFNNALVPTNFTDFYYPVGLGFQSNSVIYYGKLTISNVNMSPLPSYAVNMRQITVTVNWTNSGQGKTNGHSISMQTYAARYGVQNYVYTH